MTRSQAWRNRLRGPRASLCISLPALAACLTAFALAPHDRLLEPLTLLLALCTLVATVAFVGLDDRVIVDASFVSSTLAIGFLGPAPAFAFVVIGELGSWCLRPYRTVVIPINLISLGIPAILFAQLFELAGPAGMSFYLVLGLFGLGAVQLNDLLLTTLMGLLDDEPIAHPLRQHLEYIPVIAINILFALGAASLYTKNGLAAIALVLFAIIAFNYMLTKVLTAQRRAEEIAQLASSRQRLAMQAFDAEERERQRLAERIHDEAIQDLLVARQELASATFDAGSRDRVAVALDTALTQLRGAVFSLHPVVVRHAGLGPALGDIASKEAELGHFVPELSIDPAAAGLQDRLIITIVRELLANVRKHATASRVDVAVRRINGSIGIDVSDDGAGFDHEHWRSAITHGHIGLASIAERVEAVGGQVTITTNHGSGTHVQVALPAP